MKCAECGYEMLSVQTRVDGSKRCDLCQIAWLDVTVHALILVLDVLTDAAPLEVRERVKAAIVEAAEKVPS